MLSAARALMLVAATAATVVLFALMAVEPAFFGLVVAVAMAVGWCRFLERSADRPW